jgi:ribosome assembly protein YihI (activator of Der GTPase)
LEQKVDDALAADSKYKSILDKYNAGQTISDEERAYIRTKKAEVLK